MKKKYEQAAEIYRRHSLKYLYENLLEKNTEGFSYFLN